MTHDAPGNEPRHEPGSDPLAARLRAWRRRQDASCNQAALAARVGAAVRSDAALVPAPALQPHGRWIERSTWFATGLAAALAVVWFTWSVRRDDAPADWPPSVRFAAGHIAEKTALVAGMEATFGAGLAWIAEHDRRVDIGLVPDGAGGEPVAVRLVLLTRRAGEKAWQPAWRSDVVARDEQVVDVATGVGGAGRLRLWTHALPDGAFAIDGQLTLADAALPVEASYSGVQRPGEPCRVTGARGSDVEWQIIQTIVPLASSGRAAGEVG